MSSVKHCASVCETQGRGDMYELELSWLRNHPHEYWRDKQKLSFLIIIIYTQKLYCAIISVILCCSIMGPKYALAAQSAGWTRDFCHCGKPDV